MHLGDFDSSYKNLLELKKVMNDEKQVEIFINDFNKFKNEYFNNQKNLAKKGIFGSNLYEDKIIKKRIGLPRFNPKENTCFFFDFLYNNDDMNPQKIKFELFDSIDKDNELLNSIYKIIIEEINTNKLINKNIDFDLNDDNTIVLFKNLNSKINNNFESYNNNLPFTENVLLLLHKIKINNNELNFNIEISTKRLDENNLKDYIIIGRCFYNHQSVIIFSKKNMKGTLKIISSDIINNN